MTAEPVAVPVGDSGSVQRDAWQRRLLPPVEQIRSDLWSIPVPIPNNPIRYTSVYVLAGDSGVTLVDAGWDSDESWRALVEGLASFGCKPTDVRGVLLTHLHFDHVGLAVRIQAASDASVAMHSADLATLRRADFRHADLAVAASARHLVRLGAPAEEASRLQSSAEADWRRVLPEPDRVLAEGEPAGADGWSLRTLHTPGHTAGHLCFYDEVTKLLFAGDHVLPRVSPNISTRRADPSADSLGEYLNSLRRVGSLEVTEVLPAHEWRFADLASRTAELIAHHESRLQELTAAVHAEPNKTPWDYAAALRWSRPWTEYHGFLRISAIEETASHLAHLVTRGVLRRSADRVARYIPV